MESFTRSIIPAITSSATTAHMTFLSSSNLVSLYPLNTACAIALSRSPNIGRSISTSLSMKGMEVDGISCCRNSCRRTRSVLRTARSLPLSAILPWNDKAETSGILHVDHSWKLGGFCFYVHWPSWNVWYLLLHSLRGNQCAQVIFIDVNTDLNAQKLLLMAENIYSSGQNYLAPNIYLMLHLSSCDLHVHDFVML
jgi:hypothetical protein